jgi:hypothetical protein
VAKIVLAGSLASAALGGLLAILFIAAMIAGGIYKTECITEDGHHITGWGLEGALPYLWQPGKGSESHTLTRVVLGKVGVMEDVAR